MRIVNVETFLVGNPWKNWLFVRVETDEGIYGIGEGSLGQLSKTVEAAVHEMKSFILGLEVFQTELLVTPPFPVRLCRRWSDQDVRYFGA